MHGYRLTFFKKTFVFGSNDPNEYALNMILLHIKQYIYIEINVKINLYLFMKLKQ